MTLTPQAYRLKALAADASALRETTATGREAYRHMAQTWRALEASALQALDLGAET